MYKSETGRSLDTVICAQHVPDMMIIHIVGGFLGSGKTTLLIEMAKAYISDGKKVVVLENESGEIGVDGMILNNSGLETLELPTGCICCTLTGSLQAAMRYIATELKPDVLIIEPTGLALPHKVVEIIRGTVDDETTTIIGICDAMRFPKLLEKKEDFIRMQISKSNVIWINKIDAVEFERVFEISTWLRQNCPGIPVFMVSGKTGEGIKDALSGSLGL